MHRGLGKTVRRIEIKKRDFHDFLDIYLDSVVVIITFLLGYWLSWIITNRKERKSAIQLFNYYQVYFSDQLKSVDKQLEEIQGQIVDVEQLDNSIGIPITIVNQPYHILESINKEQLMSAWAQVKKLPAEDLLDQLKFIELTKKVFSRYEHYHSLFLSRQTEIKDRWNVQMKDFHKLITDLFNLPAELLAENSDLVLLSFIYNSWANTTNEKMNYSYHRTHLISPILIHFRKVYSLSPNNETASRLIAKMHDFDLTIDEHKTSILQYQAAIIDSYKNVIIAKERCRIKS